MKNATIKNTIFTNRVLGLDDYGQTVMASTDTRATQLSNNTIVTGGSGSGKTGSYLYSCLTESLNTGAESLVVSDTKGTLHRLFAAKFRQAGYKVYKLDFANPEKSMGYNPLSYIRRYPDGSLYEKDVMTVTLCMCPNLGNDEKFWDISSQNYIAFLISYCLEFLPEEDHNLNTVSSLHNTFLAQPSLFASDIYDRPNCFSAKLYDRIKSSMVADRTWSSISSFASAQLMPYTYRESQNIFNNPNKNIEIDRISHEKSILFVNVSGVDHVYQSAINCFYTQLFSVLISEASKKAKCQLDTSVAVFIDDAANCRIENLADILSVIRSYGLSLNLIIQNLSQLKSMYSESEANTIICNSDRMLYLASNTDLNTATYFANRMNVPVNKIYTLNRDKVVLIEAGQPARILNKIAPYSYTACVLDTNNNTQKEGIICQKN